jgi:hypothetical protein
LDDGTGRSLLCSQTIAVYVATQLQNEPCTRFDDHPSVLLSLSKQQQTTKKLVFTLSLQDWTELQNQNMTVGTATTPPPHVTTTTLSNGKFRQSVLELIVLKNKYNQSNEISSMSQQQQLWLPPLLNDQTILSPTTASTLS